jgi:hypothetical protein
MSGLELTGVEQRPAADALRARLRLNVSQSKESELSA